jgi:hypothetical protein
MPVTAGLLAFDDQVGKLRNLGVTLVPDRRTPLGSLGGTYLVEFSVSSALALDVITEIPQFTFAASQLTLTATAAVRAGTNIVWDFGDGTPPVGGASGASASHTYARPGRYRVELQAVRNERLMTFAADVMVSRSRTIVPPVTAFPQIQATTGAPANRLRVACSAEGSATPALSYAWRLIGDHTTRRGTPIQFDLSPGRYAVLFTAFRNLTARIYTRQRYAPDQQVTLSGLQVATNREFDTAGVEVGVPLRNPFAAHLFGRGELVPVGEWTVELRVSDAENAFLQGVTETDEPSRVLEGLQDVVLAMEYETLPVG